jgi:hypothetical protein
VIFTWTIGDCEVEGGAEELLVAFDRQRAMRVLVLPAWFDEANRMRRFTIEVMRRLDRAGIDTLLPDLPGCNESLAPLDAQTLVGWRNAAASAARQLKATHVLAIRAGALIAPPMLPGWHYAAQSGPKLLRALLRARILAARESGVSETSDALIAEGRVAGLTLAGWRIGAAMLQSLETAEPEPAPNAAAISQQMIGGAGLWLRAEPGEDSAQADALAAIVAGAAT